LKLWLTVPAGTTLVDQKDFPIELDLRQRQRLWAPALELPARRLGQRRRRHLSRRVAFRLAEESLPGARNRTSAAHRKLKFCETAIEKLVLPDRVAAG
jgi:hypothetical protein